MKKTFLANETEGDTTYRPFAIIQTDYRVETIEKVKEAVKDEWCYKSVEGEQTSDYDNILVFEFNCVTEDGDEEFRCIQLDETAVY